MKVMEKTKGIRCPNCHKSDKVYLSTDIKICDYVCLNCNCFFYKRD